MKFTVECSQLNKALKTIAPAIKSNVVIPILESFKIIRSGGKSKIYATDLQLSIIVDFDTEAKEDFEVVIPFRTLFNISSNHRSKPATIEVDKGGVNVVIDGKKFGLGGYEKPENFPAIKDIEEETEGIELNSEMLYKLQSATSCVTLDQAGLYKDVGVRVQKGAIDFASTDKFLLYKYSEKIENKKINATASITTSFIKAIQGIEYGTLFIDAKSVKLQAIGVLFIGRQTDEKFPWSAVDGIVPDFESNCSVNKKDLIEAINDILSYGTQLPIADFQFAHDNKISILFNDIDNQYSFRGEIEAKEHPATGQTIRFNVKQLKSIIDVVEDEEVLFNIPETGYGIKIINAAGTQKQMIQSLMI